MKRFYSGLLLIALMLATILAPAKAQDGAGTIAYGETVTGEVTSRAFEVPFVFTGAAGDVIVSILSPTELNTRLNATEIILLDGEGDVLASAIGYPVTILLAELPTAGNYTLLATRQDGRTGTSEGRFALELLKPDLLGTDAVTGAVVETGIGYEDAMGTYYVIRAETSFTLNYQRTEGNVPLRVEVGQLVPEDARYHLLPAGTIEGLNVRSANLAIEPDSSGEGIFLVHLRVSDYYYGEAIVNTAYSLSISQ